MIPAAAQTGGNNTFDFLSLPNSARIAALGGNFACISDNDLTLAIPNPSLINPGLHSKLAFSYVNNYSGINPGYAAYGRYFEKLGSFAAVCSSSITVTSSMPMNPEKSPGISRWANMQ
jgi:hypothetical protein